MKFLRAVGTKALKVSQVILSRTTRIQKISVVPLALCVELSAVSNVLPMVSVVLVSVEPVAVPVTPLTVSIVPLTM